MYRLTSSIAVFLAFFIVSHARHVVFTSENGVYSYLPNSADPDVCMTPQCVISAAEILTSLDETVDPCEDFDRFTCGGWYERHELREGQPKINVMVDMKNDLQRKLRDLLESKYESSEPPFVKLLKDFYSTCIDLDNIEKDGSEPLKKMLRRLGGWPVIEGNEWDESTFDWIDSLISIRKLGYNHNTLMKLQLEDEYSRGQLIYQIQLKEPKNRLLEFSNLTIGLNDPKIAEYFRLLMKAAKLLGADDTTAEKELLEVLNFAIDLQDYSSSAQKNSWSSEENTELRRNYTVKELQKEVPQIPWLKYFNGLLNDAVDEKEFVFVHDVDFITRLADLITSTENRVIANYMMLQVVLESSEFLSIEWDSIFDAMVELFPISVYYGITYPNEEREKIRWKRCILSVEKEMETALSSYYVRRYFKEESKEESIILMKYIHREFLKLLEENKWMSEKTRKSAEEKANAIKSYIGYPKELLNDTFMMITYENITITTDSHLENILALHKMAMDEELSHLGEPYDRHKKFNPKFKYIMEVNAFYYFKGNSIIIPAAILTDPFYVKDRPNYLNFGTIGYVMGHEENHAFDSAGRYYDKDGNIFKWIDEDSDKHFVKEVQCIIDQFDNYTTIIGMKVNGLRTSNENMADIGGLKEAYLAYKSWTVDNGIEPTLPGLNYTQNQLFWISAAYTYCSKYQPERLKMMIMMDSHSPDQFRIVGPVSNMEGFSDDFKCSPDSPMNRKYKCEVW